MTSYRLKQVDIALLILFPILSVIISLSLKSNFLISTLLFFGLPALWLSYRTPKMIARSALFSVIVGIPLGIVADVVAVLDKSWFVPNTLFPRLFGLVPIEDLIWVVLLTYTIIIFYEHFLDKGKHNLIDKRMKYLVFPVILLLILTVVALVIDPSILQIKFAYLWIGIILIVIPTVTFLSSFPKLISKYVKVGVYFLLLSLVFELTALQLGHWTFPGYNFIGWVELGGLKFPFEEFFFWMILTSTAILSYYEFFDDDRK